MVKPHDKGKKEGNPADMQQTYFRLLKIQHIKVRWGHNRSSFLFTQLFTKPRQEQKYACALKSNDYASHKQSPLKKPKNKHNTLFLKELKNIITQQNNAAHQNRPTKTKHKHRYIAPKKNIKPHFSTRALENIATKRTKITQQK